MFDDERMIYAPISGVDLSTTCVDRIKSSVGGPMSVLNT